MLKKYLEKVKNNKKLIFGIALMLILCLLHAVSAGHYSNFYPINGTFQNYNPVRRLLNGQIPYKDFQDYLGLGHLYLGSIMTFLFGGTYNDSLIAFSFLSFLGLALILFVIGNIVLKKREISVAMTNIILTIILIEAPIMSILCGTENVYDAVSYALGTGNSARFVRGLILPVSIILIMLAMQLYRKHHEKYLKILKNSSFCWVFAISIIAGFAISWSNDYGISCWLCLAFFTFWVLFCRKRKFWQAIGFTVAELIISLIWTFVFVEIMTLGHFPAWLKATFGTGGYQSWYYNSPKSLFIYNVDLSFEMLLQALICILYLWKLFKERGTLYSIKRYGFLAYANMCSFCEVNEYHILSGGNSKEVALSILFATIIFEFINYLKGLKIYKGGGAKGCICHILYVRNCYVWNNFKR